MATNANLSSVNPHHHKWNLAIDSYFSKDHVVEIDLETTRCIFRLPKTTTETKPQAYYPRRLGLGPYHHLRPEFYKTQLHKISRVRRFLGPDKLEAFKEIVGDLVQREPIVRACYDEYLDFDMKTLARIIAVDALYLLQLFDARRNGEISDGMEENVIADILMEENQIPVVLFKVILEVLQLHEISSSERVLSTEFREFCEAHSPLELNKTRCEWVDKKQLHLLDRMYNSILINRGHQISSDILTELAQSVSTIIGISGAHAESPPQIQSMVARASKIREQLKGGAVANEEIASSYTAFELSEISGVKFERSAGGIRDIMYHVNRKSLQFPSIRIDGNTVIVLRNLVAYEEASAVAEETLELAEYLDLMCCLIRSVKDVIILKKAEILTGVVSNEGVVGVFDEIGTLIGDIRKRRSKFVFEDFSKTHDEKANSKVKRIVKKWWRVASRFVILVFAAAALVVLLINAFCSALGCGRWFDGSTGINYADQ